MKLILAIVQPKDSARLRRAFVKANIGTTKLSSTGGFLKEGNTTFMMGVEDERVDEVLNIIDNNAKTREEYITAQETVGTNASAIPIKVTIGGATVFALPVDKFVQF